MKKKNNILFSLIKKNLHLYILGLSTLLLVDYVNLLIPEYTGNIIDGLTNHTLDIHGVVSILLALVVSSLIVVLGRMCWRMCMYGVSRVIENGIRNDLFKHLETLSIRYFNYHKTGDLMSHFTNDLEALRNALGPAIVSSFDAIVLTLLVLYKMMTQVDFKLTVLVLIPMSIIAIGGYYFGEMMEKRFSEKQKSFGILSDYVQESISGERVIKAFCQEQHQGQAFNKVNENNYQTNMRVVKMMATLIASLDFIIGITYVIALVYGGYLTITSQITLGKFIAFNQYIGRLIWPMIALGDALTSFSQGRASMKRLLDVFNETSEIQEIPNATLHEAQGDIVFSNISF